MQVYIKIGFYKINIIPFKQKKIKKKRFKLFRRKKVKKVVEKKFKEEQKKEKKEARRYTAGEIIDISKDLGLTLFRKTKKYLKIKIYKINIKVGSEDAYNTAKLYANINQCAYYLYEILKNNFNIKARNINISSDFLSGKVNFDIDLKMGMKIGAGLNITMAMAIAFVKFWSKSKKNNNIKIKKESENKWQTAT
jgi:hypothetical protein